MIPFPRWCLQCSRFISWNKRSPNGFICPRCYEQLPFFDQTLCVKCGGQHQTEDCQIPWAVNIESFHSLFTYEEPLNRWISTLKYSKNLMIGRMMQQMLKCWLEDNQHYFNSIDCIVPVPIHPLRLNSRSFNQACYLIDKQNLLKTDPAFIKKTKWTPQQTGQTKKERIGNLKGSFKLQKDPTGLKLLIFDDVCTTGQTLAEISKMLITAGAHSVDALTFCRTLVD